MRLVAIVLAALLLLIQWPLWFGKGGWLRASELERQLAAQKTVNAGLGERNAQLAAEVEAYVARHYPPLPSARHAAAKDFLKQLIVPILIFAALGGFYLWSQLK